MSVSRVDLLVVPDCANHDGAVTLIAEALDQSGCVDTPVIIHVIATEDEGRQWDFAGSPTFLIDGVDPFPSAPSTGALSCRIYPTGTGLPSLAELAAALRGSAVS
ncbi:hypothetical protein [Gordonia hydrophobica]|uniref:Thioredoxin family protein n=1 Tax=Gordonia hydrophobica TaxID=40516 RepID=A0ABZ2U5Q0_9ACTN|nr:hypothetical protein [Gordonia hydrophobica]MBM7368712.1 hypothetical protein [Gordonia hydrophobica]